jgi:hypothetical protein
LPSVARHIAIAFWNFPLNPLFLHLAVQHTFLRRYIKVGYSGSIDVPAAPAEDDLTVVRA